jgi:hypothetical protein
MRQNEMRPILFLKDIIYPMDYIEEYEYLSQKADGLRNIAVKQNFSHLDESQWTEILLINEKICNLLKHRLNTVNGQMHIDIAYKVLTKSYLSYHTHVCFEAKGVLSISSEQYSDALNYFKKAYEYIQNATENLSSFMRSKLYTDNNKDDDLLSQLIDYRSIEYQSEIQVLKTKSLLYKKEDIFKAFDNYKEISRIHDEELSYRNKHSPRNELGLANIRILEGESIYSKARIAHSMARLIHTEDKDFVELLDEMFKFLKYMLISYTESKKAAETNPEILLYLESSKLYKELIDEILNLYSDWKDILIEFPDNSEIIKIMKKKDLKKYKKAQSKLSPDGKNALVNSGAFIVTVFALSLLGGVGLFLDGFEWGLAAPVFVLIFLFFFTAVWLRISNKLSEKNTLKLIKLIFTFGIKIPFEKLFNSSTQDS